MNEFNEKMMDAAEDIRYLLGRGYPGNGAVRFVAGHYLLKDTERFILSRNILAPAIARSRQEKRCSCNGLEGQHLVVDVYNVLITLESYLKGEDMWLGDDGFIRDNRGVFSNHINDATTFAAVEMMMAMLVVWKIGPVDLLLDSQMSRSGELAAFIRQKMEENSIKGTVLTSKTVDYELKRVSGNLIVATADGVIIDAVAHVVDIPACIIARKGGNKILLHSLSTAKDFKYQGRA